MEDELINLAIPGGPRQFYTYRIDTARLGRPAPGQRCLVPFGRRKVWGYFIERASQIPEVEIKEVLALPEPDSLFSEELFRFLQWMADYYFCGLADVLTAALPPELRQLRKPTYCLTPAFPEQAERLGLASRLIKNYRGREFLTSRTITSLEKKHPGAIGALVASGAVVASYHSPRSVLSLENLLSDFKYFQERPDTRGLTPNDEQQSAMEAILAGQGKFSSFLLHGITGSGKTLVYCRVVEEFLQQGKTALVMVPEIALAGTLLSYFRNFFGDRIALMHSALRRKERLAIWQNIRDGRYPIVIGPRSAIFAPLKNLGIIIVDEEHDESYKQDDPSPRFQGRDAAVMRAKMANIPIVLGSATPSFESFQNARDGRYQLLQLTRRPEQIELPLVRLIDLKEERVSAENLFFTATLRAKVNESLERSQQVILYLNRRGFSPRIKCTDCGHTPLCPHCELHLTYHRVGNKLMCHFCGYLDPGYNRCAICQGEKFVYIGTGTQKVEDRIGEIFPSAKMIRLDSDSASGRDRAHIILSDFASGKYNLLLGTQMVTKGIDFPNVSLVGVLMADIGMEMPDFRAPEKLFAKLIQVAGRSGRGIIPGEVIIQTYNPETPLIDDAARQDYETFFEREIRSRKQLRYPPFSHIINFRFACKKEEDAVKFSREFRDRLKDSLDKSALRTEILGPAPCPLYRLRGMYRRHLFIKVEKVVQFVKFLDKWEQTEKNFGLPSRVKLTVDVDPYDMM
jgi:primosomal protein N' (replication factor Y)